MALEVLREVWRITERRGGATYRTKFVERRWVPMGEDKGRPDNDNDLMWVTVSDPEVTTIRRVTAGDE